MQISGRVAADKRHLKAEVELPGRAYGSHLGLDPFCHPGWTYGRHEGQRPSGSANEGLRGLAVQRKGRGARTASINTARQEQGASALLQPIHVSH